MDDLWSYSTGGDEVFGPLPFKDIKTLVDQKILAENVLVIRQGTNEWVPLSESPFLQTDVAGSETGAIQPPPPGRSNPDTGTVVAPKQKRSLRKTILLVLLGVGIVSAYFGKDRLMQFVQNVSNSINTDMVAIQRLGSNLDAIHFEAAMKYNGREEEQIDYLTSKLQTFDVSKCPPSVQVAFRDYISSWDEFLLPRKNAVEFYDLLLLLGGHSDWETTNVKPEFKKIIGAYNEISKASLTSGAFLRPVADL